MWKFIFAIVFAAQIESTSNQWSADPIWHDGLVEKAVYTASRPIYGKDRQYDAIFFTNKEQHDLRTLTKANRSKETVEVWKHNHIEVVPTPNYDYKFETTSHFAVDTLQLTRLDCSSQEFCGTSFKQFWMQPGESALSYFLFSYMPEAGRVEGKLEVKNRAIVPIDSLPLWLRNYDFGARKPVEFAAIASQKSNRQTSANLIEAEVRFAGEENDAYKLEVRAARQLLGTFWMAKDRQHVMLRAELADGQKYQLKTVERVNYWSIVGE
jgi:hypothetical protein